MNQSPQKKPPADNTKRRRFRLSEEEREMLRRRPNGKFLSGVLLIGISFVIGWPGVTFAGYIAYVLNKPAVFIVGGPAVYLLSHLVWSVGMYLTGVESIVYVKVFYKWIAGRLAGENQRIDNRDEDDAPSDALSKS